MIRKTYYYVKYLICNCCGIKIKNSSQQKYWQWITKDKVYQPENYMDIRFREIWSRLTLGVDFRNKTLLDYGCNNGIWSREYMRRGAICTGIDYITPTHFVGDGFIKEDITKYKSKRQVDFVHSTRVLMHLEHARQEEAIQRIRDNLKEGGDLLIIEQTYSGGAQRFSRNWKSFIEFFGFEIVKYVSDGVLEGILARKR